MRRIILTITFMMGLLVHSTAAKAFNFDPGDYVAAPPGTNLIVTYHGYLGDLGDVSGTDFNANINLFRLVWYREFLGITVDPQIIFPYGNLDLDVGGGGVASASGLGDTILGITFWVYNTKQTQLGLTPFLQVPIGDYDNDELLNLGENRWKLTLQAGFVHFFTPKFLFETAVDVTFYGSNSDFTAASVNRDQDETFEWRLSGRYNFTPKLALGAQFSYIHQGENTIAGVKQNDDNDIISVSGYLQYMLKPDLQLQLKYDHQLDQSAPIGSLNNAVGDLHAAELRLVKIY